MLDMAILGLLEERDLHGYEIRRQLRDNLGILANVSFGSIYPALTRLEKSGAVVATEGSAARDATPAAAPKAPPTGSLSGELAVLRARRHSPTHSRRGKKVYRITEKGRQLFVQLLADGSSLDDARSFGLRLAFARHLAPQARLALLERRRAQLVQRLAEAARDQRRTRRLRPLGRAAHGRQRRPGHQLARPADRQRTRHTPAIPVISHSARSHASHTASLLGSHRTHL